MQQRMFDLMAQQEYPCVSLYMPLLPSAVKQRENARRLMVVLDDIESRLEGFQLSPRAQKQFLAPARTFAEQSIDAVVGSKTLALFLSPSSFHPITLDIDCEPRVVVGKQFHLTPLLSSTLSPMHYHILSVSKDRVRFFEVDGPSVTQRTVEGLPDTIQEAWDGMERQEKSLQFHSSGDGNAMFHGQGGAKDAEEQEEDRFMHTIAKSLHTILHEQADPLVFAGVEEQFGMFRTFDQSQTLLDDYIRGNPDRMSGEELREKAEPLVKEWMMKKNEALLEEYGNVQGTGRTTTDLGMILGMAHNGKIDLLILPEGSEQWGIFTPDNGKVQLHERQQDGSVELNGLAAQHTVRHRGRVIMVKPDKMPEGGKIAAILRY